MSGRVIIPQHYLSKLDLLETEVAIKAAKDIFENQLAAVLGLTRVSAPLFVRPETGLNDDLNGVERPVQFDIPDIGGAQVRSSSPWPSGSGWPWGPTASPPAPAFTLI